MLSVPLKEFASYSDCGMTRLIQIGSSLGILTLSSDALGQATDFPAAAMRSLFSLVVVLAIIIAAAYFARNFSRARLGSGSGENPIQIVAQRSLGTREKLVLVEIDGQRILLGVSHGAIRAVHGGCSGTRDSTGPKESD